MTVRRTPPHDPAPPLDPRLRPAPVRHAAVSRRLVRPQPARGEAQAEQVDGLRLRDGQHRRRDAVTIGRDGRDARRRPGHRLLPRPRASRGDPPPEHVHPRGPVQRARPAPHHPGKCCGQLLCSVGEAMPAGLLVQPEVRYLAQLGFSSNLDPKTFKRAPLHLVAVIDKSGSMSGQPLELVKESLIKVVSQLGPDDELSIVLYGDRSHVYLQPTRDPRPCRDRRARSAASPAPARPTWRRAWPSASSWRHLAQVRPVPPASCCSPTSAPTSAAPTPTASWAWPATPRRPASA
jgi:hypothetical protein